MDITARGWAIGLACRGMAVAAVVAAVGNLVQVLQGNSGLLVATIGPLVGAAAVVALIAPIERGRPWAVPLALLVAVAWIATAVLVETEAGVYLYACFGSIYVTMLAQIASERPARWALVGGVYFLGLLGLRQALDPVASLAEPTELLFTAGAGGVATWAVSAWVIRILGRLQAVNADLVEARDAALGANRLKDQFLANMSHELRTPLTAIQGYAEFLLEDGQLGHQASVDVQAIQGSARHLTDLLSAVLELSRIEAGERVAVVETVDLESLIDDVVQMARPLALTGHNEIDVELHEGLGRAETDGTAIRQILLNLVGNACKFTEHGRVRVVARRDGSQLELVVADTGMGIPEDQLEAVFDRFVQADGSSTRRHDGVGLGLALVHRLCTMLGGGVEVESTVGTGSTFRVRLPVA